jgi:hypothetical protein
MAHHNSTPESVLNAPWLTPVTLWSHDWPNRYNRRHFRTKSGKVVNMTKQVDTFNKNVPATQADLIAAVHGYAFKVDTE